jgi:cell pole-organizing protein PopZ
MSDSRHQNEPSMEEILASIRRIIAEDADAGGKASEAAGEQDILELTDKVEPDGSVVSLASRLAPRSEPRETPPIAVAPDATTGKEEPPPPAVEAPKPPEPSSERVISPGAAAASVAALSELAREVPRAAAVVGGEAAAGDRALEETTRELLKPLLKTWLDAHLPPLIERIVREEIARLAREARGG